MTGGRLFHTLSRIAVILVTVGSLVGISRGVVAAPQLQVEPYVEEIRRQVSQVRGLPVLADTPVVTLPRAALVERLSRGLNGERAVREFLTSQMVLEVFGAMQRGFDLRDLQLRLLTEQSVAVYDFESRSIYLIDEYVTALGLGADARLVVAHELTHALQDQHFDLRRVLPANAASADAAIAARALVEGDAMLTMRIWGRQFLRPDEKRVLGDETPPKDPILDAAPPLVQGELLFPYDAGWVFAQLLFQDGGFAALDRAFARPPRSTEQVLHPEKYATDEAPVPVELPDLERGLAGTWESRRTDVFGELVLRLLLEPHVGWPTAEAAAAGWGGDAYTILEDEAGRRVVALVTVWDTESDAAEMYNAFVLSIAAQHGPNQQRTVAQPAVARWSIPGYEVQALKTDNRVRIVYAPDGATLDRVEVLLGGTPIAPTTPAAPRPPDPVSSPSPFEPPSGAPTVPGAATPPTGLPAAPPSDPGRFSPPSGPANPANPATTPEPLPTLPPVQPMVPTGGAVPATTEPADDVQTAPTPPPIPTLPRVTPVPAPVTEDEELPEE